MNKIVIALCLALFAFPAAAQQLNTSVLPAHSTAVENNHIFKATGGRLYKLAASNATSTAGFIMVFDSSTVPSTGTVAPVLCRALPANGTATIDFMPTPAALFASGIVAVASSGASCTVYTTGTITAWFDAILQ